MAGKFRGITWNNARFGPKIQVRRSIDMAELGDFGFITDDASDLPTRGAAHRADHGGSTSATRGHTDLRGISGQHSNVVDTQDMGLITDATTTHRIWSSTGAITDVVTSAPTTLYNPGNSGSSGATSSGGGSTQYDYTDVESASVSLSFEFDHPNPTRNYHNLGKGTGVNSTHAFFLEGDVNNGYKVYAVNLSTNNVDWTIDLPTGSSNRITDDGIQANEQYLLVSTSGGGRLYSLSTQQLVGTITGGYSGQMYKMTDNYVAYISSSDLNQVDVRELDPDNNFPLVNSFTGTWGPNPGDTGSQPGNSNTNTYFGYSSNHFDLSDTHIVIGAPMYKYDYQGTSFDEHQGKVEVFNIQTGAIEHTFYGRDGIHHTSTASNHYIRFGKNISIDGDNVAIRSESSSSISESGIRVYNYKTGDFVTSIDKPQRPSSSSFIGSFGQYGLVLKDGLVFAHIDNHADNNTTRYRRTAIFVYNFDGNQVLRIDDPDFDAVYSNYEATGFGKDSIEVSGNKLVIGAYMYSTVSNRQMAGFQEGKGYIYDLTKTYAEV